MKRSFFAKAFAFTFCLMVIGASAVAQDSDQSLLDKLKWKNDMMHIKLDLRTDFVTTFNSNLDDETSFKGQTFKVWLVGKITPNISYRVRQRWNRFSEPLGRDRLSSATDQAYLAFKLCDYFSIIAGKQSVQYGTFEYDYNPADVYLPTLCFDDLDAYKTGVDFVFNIPKHEFHFQIVNSDAPQFATQDYKNKALAYNLLWAGDMLDGTLKTRCSYHLTQKERGDYFNFFTLGLQVNLGAFSTELDYYNGMRMMSISKNPAFVYDPVNDPSVKDQSFSANFKYYKNKWGFFVKGLWDQRHDYKADSKAFEDWGLNTGIEYLPLKGENLRVHLVYGHRNTDYKYTFTNKPTEELNSITLGVRWLFKVM